MRVLELFAGSRSIGKVCDEKGYDVFSSDHQAFDKIDYAVDILDFDLKKLSFKPDVVWASPPCTTFSVASIGTHWTENRQPKTEAAILGLKILHKTIDLIQQLKKQNVNLIWYVENPRGMMRKMDIWKSIKHIRRSVTYCQYGDKRMKPTDIWTNNVDWMPRPMCKNGSPCHESAPRGSQTGTQGIKGNYNRSKIPHELCEEILINSENVKIQNWML